MWKKLERKNVINGGPQKIKGNKICRKQLPNILSHHWRWHKLEEWIKNPMNRLVQSLRPVEIKS